MTRFSTPVTAFVVAATGAVIAAAVIARPGVVPSIILALILLLGALAIAVARKSDRGAVGPATCRQCGGLMSPHAPYCKHCGAPVGG